MNGKQGINWFNIVMAMLRNFPSLALDMREVVVPATATITKKRGYSTATGDFSVDITIKNKVIDEKKFKVIVFITDL